MLQSSLGMEEIRATLKTREKKTELQIELHDTVANVVRRGEKIF